MGNSLAKLRVHAAMYACYCGWRRRRYAEWPKQTVALNPDWPSAVRVHFWTPVNNAGAKVLVHDMVPDLQQLAAELQLPWQISAGAALPNHPLDWLVCLKAVPPADQPMGRPRTVLLICDQVELFWEKLIQFDEVVATASRPLARLLAFRHPRVSFIPESEPARYVDFGRDNLRSAPGARGNVVLWHGGKYTQDSLTPLTSVLAEWAQQQPACLHIISGDDPPREERWGALPVMRFPWSEAQLFRSAAQARLGILPARASLKNSWLKPASRAPCLQALGVPTIGDGRVPDVVEFMRRFNGPMAASPAQWRQGLATLWQDTRELQRLAEEGHAVVAREFTTTHTARQWIQFLARRGPAAPPGT
jgi:hypothetical protein